MKKSTLALSIGILVSTSSTAYAQQFPPETVTAEVFGLSLTPSELCHKFNNMVDRSNQWLQDNNYNNSQISKDLCSAIPIDSRYSTQYYYDIPTASRWDAAWEYWLDEEVDISETQALLIFSSVSGETKRTRYMLYNDSSAQLVKQKGAWNYAENAGANQSYGDTRLFTVNSGGDGKVLPTYWWRLDAAMWQYTLTNTWHGTNFKSFVVDASNKELLDKTRSDTISFLRAGNMPITESTIELYQGHFLFNTCVGEETIDNPDNNGAGLASCIPGGADNNNFDVEEVYPSSDFNDRGDVTVSTSSTVSLDISGNIERDSDGMSAGLDIGFSQEFSKEISDDIKVMELEKDDQRINLGSSWTYKLNPTAISDLSVSLEDKFSGIEGRTINANAAFGEGSWKDADLSSQYVWRETSSAQNCVEGNEREMWFVNSHDVTRGGMAVRNNYIKRELIKHEGTYQYVRADKSNIIKVNTVCKDGFRIHKRGLLNQN
ncbi:hypothetical protein BS333_16350 [Vibrio azureus]|uniref:Uncharacterized protein n=1 Tax=Vibrio azureus NBRC 104587 TaxID=1219077 RepID=U3C4M6_9VIBR|nr:hypothetical protein [Vibrio azureus]AUI87955.1 hypothetical protein BS333_16350 [Vibrio azureus]GAD76359.1 hypothetical protein VAZ01S_041_00610 [Vibrio azureus NBRC 104587]